MKLLACLVSLLLLQTAACTSWKTPRLKPLPPVSPEERYDRTDVDALLRFSDVIARANSKERLQECQRVRELAEARPGIGVRLHLFLVQLLTGECGDIAKTVEIIRSRRGEIMDEGTQRLFAYQEQTLARLDQALERCRSLEQQLRVTSQKAQTTHRQMKTRESEIKSLQDKLDALKSIEQNLGGSQGAD